MLFDPKVTLKILALVEGIEKRLADLERRHTEYDLWPEHKTQLSEIKEMLNARDASEG